MHLPRTALCGLLLSAPAAASSYELDVIKSALGMEDGDVARLKAQGIATTAQLFDRAGTRRATRGLAKVSGVDEQKLAAWVKACDLLRVPGIGPDVARVLAAVGVRNARSLAKRKADALSRRIEKINAKQRLTENTPSEGHLAAWIELAAALPPPK